MPFKMFRKLRRIRNPPQKDARCFEPTLLRSGLARAGPLAAPTLSPPHRGLIALSKTLDLDELRTTRTRSIAAYPRIAEEKRAGSARKHEKRGARRRPLSGAKSYRGSTADG